MSEISFVEKPIPFGHPNRQGYTFVPRGVVWHRTAGDSGAEALGNYFARMASDVVAKGTYGSTQLACDDLGIWRYMPLDEVAWHVAGDIPEHNRNFEDLGVEDCQYHDDPPRVRAPTYANMVKLAVWLCETGGGQHARRAKPYWTPKGINPDDGDPYFTRHSDWDPVNRPHDPGEYLRWPEFLTDVENALGGSPWAPREEEDMNDEQLKQFLNKLEDQTDAYLIYLGRQQRGVDVVGGKAFDPSLNGKDPAPEVLEARRKARGV